MSTVRFIGARLAALMIAMALAIAACSGSTGSQGPQGPAGPQGPSIPIIQSITATGLPAARSGSVNVTASAQSPQGLTLTYAWTVTGTGWTIASGADTATVTLTAPDTYADPGSAIVTVTDSNGKSATGNLALVTVDNGVPVISSISIFPQPVTSAANLVASASDPDGDPLTYSWTVGGILNLLTGPSAIWVSPGIPGYYQVGLSVSDGFGATTSGLSAMTISSGSAWPEFHRDIQSTGLSPVSTTNSPAELWTFTTGAFVSAGPVVGADGTVYAGSGDDSLYAITPCFAIGCTPVQKWKFTTGGRIESAAAVAADGTVYLGSSDGNLYAINPDGTQKWKFTGAAVASSPVIGADGTIYVGSIDDNLYAITPCATTGCTPAQKWKFTTGGMIESAASIASDGTIYVGSFDNSLYAINPDGTQKWKFSQATNAMSSAPTIGPDGTIYAGSQDGNLYAVNPNGTLKWKFKVGGTASGAITFASPAIGADGTLYVGGNPGNFFAINPDGSQKWVSTLVSGTFSSAAVSANGTIYVGGTAGLFRLNPDGTEAGITATDGDVESSPAIGADGTVYFGSDDHKVYAIGFNSLVP